MLTSSEWFTACGIGFGNDFIISPLYSINVRLTSHFDSHLKGVSTLSSPHAPAWGFIPSLTIGSVCIATQEHGNEKTLK